MPWLGREKESLRESAAPSAVRAKIQYHQALSTRMPDCQFGWFPIRGAPYGSSRYVTETASLLATLKRCRDVYSLRRALHLPARYTYSGNGIIRHHAWVPHLWVFEVEITGGTVVERAAQSGSRCPIHVSGFAPMQLNGLYLQTARGCRSSFSPLNHSLIDLLSLLL